MQNVSTANAHKDQSADKCSIKAQMNVRTSKYTGITFNGTHQSVY